MITKISTGIAPSSSPVSDAIKVGNQLWTVVVSEDPSSGDIVGGDITVQTHRALDNLAMALKAAGGSLANVVQVQIFLIDKADAAGMNAVYAQYFKEPYPVRATVVVKELLAEGLRIELLVSAML